MGSGSGDNAFGGGSHDNAIAPITELIDNFSTLMWGDGTDGAYAQNGGAVTYTGAKHYTSITLTGAATYGPTAQRFGTLYCQGLTSITGGSWLQSLWRAGEAGGVSRNTVGVGNNGAHAYLYMNDSSQFSEAIAGTSGGGANGGGGGAAQAGGRGGSHRNRAMDWGEIFRSQAVVAGVGAGANGNTTIAPAGFADASYSGSPFWRVGWPGSGGGGGAVDSVGTGAAPTSGAGGTGGNAGGHIHLRTKFLTIDGTSGLTVAGENGTGGANAVDSGGADADAGGGAGGGGAGGGSIALLYESRIGGVAIPARCIVTGGAGGAGGTPVGIGGAGGIGGLGADGFKGIAYLRVA